MANKAYYIEFDDDYGKEWRLELLPHVENPDIPLPKTFETFPDSVVLEVSGIDFKFDNNLPVGMELPPVMKIKCEFTAENIKSELASLIIKTQSQTYYEVQGDFAYFSVQIPNVWRLFEKIGDGWVQVFCGVQNLPKSKKFNRSSRGVEYELECTSFFRWASGALSMDSVLSYCKLDSEYIDNFRSTSTSGETNVNGVFLTHGVQYHYFRNLGRFWHNEYYPNNADMILLTRVSRIFTEFRNMYDALYNLVIQETIIVNVQNPIKETFGFYPNEIQLETDTQTYTNMAGCLLVAYVYNYELKRIDSNKDFIVNRFKTFWDFLSALANQTERPYLFDSTNNIADVPAHYTVNDSGLDTDMLIYSDSTDLETGYESIDRVEASMPYNEGTLAKYTVRPDANNNATTAALTVAVNNARLDFKDMEFFDAQSKYHCYNPKLAGGLIYVFTGGVIKAVTGAINGNETAFENKWYTMARYFKWLTDNLHLSLAGSAADALYAKFSTFEQSIIELEIESVNLKPQLLGAKISIDTEKIFGLDLSDYVKSSAYITGIVCDDLKKGRWKFKIFVEG